MLNKLFKLDKFQTNVKTEIIAGITTFATMGYILIVNPQILAISGMDKGAVFTATALSAIFATLVMAFYANKPFALAPGMGLNAFFAFTVVKQMGYSWQFALTAVFIEGIIFLILTFFNIRTAIINSIPFNLKKAVSVGIGLFIAFIGLQHAGIITANSTTLVTLGNITTKPVILSIIGLIVTGFLLTKNIKGALILGIIFSTLLGVPLGVTHLPANFQLISLPPSIAPTFLQFDFSNIFSLDMLIVLFTFLFIDLFDTAGTLIGVSTKAGFIDENGNLPGVKKALFADAAGTTVGAMLGTSTVTTYVESASGVAAGGRTGLTAFSTAVVFAIALLMAPLFTMVPSAATAPALILVGLFMMSPIKKIDLTDYTEAIPAFLTIIIMPLAYSIAEGIAFGMIAFVILKLLAGKGKKVSILSYIIAVLFILKYLFL
ncbi:MAG: NCS2 family permease [Candidatus Marinimicrobia bacterium]|nr:NCS2 family permease [Candidatus Neomarinimicrobiota bacterium]